MEIQSSFVNQSGQLVGVVYTDIESERDLGIKKVRSVHAFCFCGDKLVLVYSSESECWAPPGGKLEAGEDVQGAVRREVHEETNMNVLAQRIIGYQDVTAPDTMVTQTRSVCIVEPYGPFVKDPDGDITEIKLIDPQEYKKYFDWGEVGEHIMQRALELKVQLDMALSSSE